MAVGLASVQRLGLWTPAQQFREFASARGSRTTITLRDGSRLVLGPATRLRVPRDFGVSSRDVTLDGEALFTVVHDTRRPFTVRTAHTTIRDVGTTFVVRAYPGDANERIAVREGEVALSGTSLRAHDLASVDTAGRVTVHRGGDLAMDFGWAQGALVFKNTPLRAAVEELGRTYDVTIVIADSALSDHLITASFSNDELMDEVLGAVTHVVGAHYDRRGRTVVIHRGATPIGRPGSAPSAELRLTRTGGGR
jgi:ferric-dicitrate binding protein FerR (iron transport regulator)